MEYTVKKLLSPYLYNDIASICQSNLNFDCFKNKTVFITGAGQLVGYYLACAFLIGNDLNSNNTKIIVCDKEENLFEKYGNLNSRTDIDFLISKTYSNLPREKSDYIIHTDTQPDKDYFDSAVNLLKYAQESKTTSVIFCSHMDIYGCVYNGRSRLAENDLGYIDLANPDNHTLQNRRMTELFGKKTAQETGLDIKFARLSAVMGALHINSNPFNKFVTSALMSKNKASTKNMQYLTEDSDIIKSYCYVTDTAVALLKLLTQGKSGEAYNVCAGWDTSLKYITEVCRQLFPDLKLDIAYKGNNISNDYNISPLSCTRQILDNAKLLKLGFTPRVNLAEAIKRTVKIIEENL